METEFVRCKCIVNAAGSGAAAIARMIEDESFSIKMRLGEYLLLNRNQGHLVTRTIFPCPGPLGKGVLVQRTVRNSSLCVSLLKVCFFSVPALGKFDFGTNRERYSPSRRSEKDS